MCSYVHGSRWYYFLVFIVMSVVNRVSRSFVVCVMPVVAGFATSVVAVVYVVVCCCDVCGYW